MTEAGSSRRRTRLEGSTEPTGLLQAAGQLGTRHCCVASDAPTSRHGSTELVGVAKCESWRRFQTIRAIRERLFRRIMRSTGALDPKLLRRFLKACEVEGQALMALHCLMQRPRAEVTTKRERQRQAPTPCKRARSWAVSANSPPDIPLEVAMLRLQAWLRCELVQCTPRHPQPQATLLDMWKRRDPSDMRQAAAVRQRAENQAARRCDCCRQDARGAPVCAVDVGGKAFRDAFREADFDAHAVLEREGVPLSDAVRQLLEVTGSQRKVYGWTWRSQPEKHQPNGPPAFDEVLNRVEARRAVGEE